MVITFEPTRLDLEHGDDEAVLVMRDGRLVAVLSRLGGMHGLMLGHWFVEAIFSLDVGGLGETFPNLDAFEAHLADKVH